MIQPNLQKALLSIPNDFFQNVTTTLCERPACEDDEAFRQLLPYVVVKYQGKVFTYRRGGAGDESRLHSKLSVGLGGHVDSTPMNDMSLAEHLQNEACHEIEEEIGIAVSPAQIQMTHFIVDNSDAVGRVHLGLLIELELSHAQYIVSCDKLEAGQIEHAYYTPPSELYTNHTKFNRLENWSQMAIEMLHETAQPVVAEPNREPAVMRDLETGEPSVVTIDEDTGRLIQALSTALEFMFKGPQVALSDERLTAIIKSLNIGHLLGQAKIVLATNVTPAVPYMMVVDSDYPKQSTLGLTLAKAMSELGMTCGPDIIINNQASEHDTRAILSELGWKIYHAQQILNIFGWTWDDVKMSNRLEIVEKQQNTSN